MKDVEFFQTIINVQYRLPKLALPPQSRNPRHAGHRGLWSLPLHDTELSSYL